MIKKYWPYIGIAVVLIAVLIIRDINKGKQIQSLKDQLGRSERIVSKEKEKIQEITRKMVDDSINYEKEKKHIQELRGRYPNDALLDSLVRAGQSID